MEKYIERAVKQVFLKKMQPNKVLVLLGARRVGKTMFLKNLMEKGFSEPLLFLNGEDLSTVGVMEERTVENYKRLIGDHKLLIIDEAQKIPEIGLKLKLMVDHIEGIKIIVTGSSVFDMTNKLGEPLTGRKYSFFLHPLAQMEFSKYENLVETRSRLEERLIFGSYPELVEIKSNSGKSDYLNEVVNSYLLKDILEIDGVRNSSTMLNLLRLVSFQVGKPVSLEELGRQLGISRNTVERHLDLLSKVFVIYRVSGFSRNLRNEVTKTAKWYFYDNGIRNALITNINPLSLRNDTGILWENYVLAERIKYQAYTGMLVNNYFWRTYQQQEIDWIEERDGKLFAFEIKWSSHKKSKAPSAWSTGYPESEFKTITPENYLEWIK